MFFCDETGVNRLALNRLYGYSKRGTRVVAARGSQHSVRGPNVSVIIGVGTQKGVIATHMLSGDVKDQAKRGKSQQKARGRRRGTNRNDFCHFLRRRMFPAMLGVPQRVA